MKRCAWLVVLAAACICAGCHSDIVCTARLRQLDAKRVHIEPIKSRDPYVGQVLRDVLEKELIRKKVIVCEPDLANVFISGSTFMTSRYSPQKGLFGDKPGGVNEAIESVSVVAKDRSGQVLLTASYDNKEQQSVSKLAKEFGSALAGKLR